MGRISSSCTLKIVILLTIFNLSFVWFELSKSAKHQLYIWSETFNHFQYYSVPKSSHGNQLHANFPKENDLFLIDEGKLSQLKNHELKANGKIIYRVYFDYRNKAPKIVILGFRDCTSKSYLNPIYVRSLNSPSTIQTVKLDYMCRFNWAPGCQWHYFISSAPIDSSWPLTLDQTTLQISSSKTFEDSKTSEIIGYPSRPSNSEPEHFLTVCVQPVFYYAELRPVVTYIETWKALGATKIAFYVVAVSKDLDIILKAYQTTGLVEIIPWPILPKIENGTTTKNGINFTDPNGSLYRFGMELAMNDCLLRYTGITKYVALFDLDEYLIPNWNNAYDSAQISLIPVLDSIFNTNSSKLAGFSIETLLVHYPKFADNKSNKTSLFNLQETNFDYLKTLPVKLTTAGPQKIVCRPDKVTNVATHLIKGIVKGYSKYTRRLSEMGKTLKSTPVLLYHMRFRPNQIFDKKPAQEFEDHVFDLIADKMKTSFAEFQANHLEQNREWKDSNFNFLSQMSVCNGRWRQKGCKSPHVMCKDIIDKNIHTYNWVTYDFPHYNYTVVP